MNYRIKGKYVTPQQWVNYTNKNISDLNHKISANLLDLDFLVYVYEKIVKQLIWSVIFLSVVDLIILLVLVTK